MKIVTLHFPGWKLGNCVMSYLWARAYAERHGCSFQCEPWIGQRIFRLDDKPISTLSLPRRSELDLLDGEVGINLYGYAQHQRAMIYTKKQGLEWLQPRIPWLEVLHAYKPAQGKQDWPVIAHRRVGDYLGYGYPVVSENSIKRAMTVHPELSGRHLQIVTEEAPTVSDRAPADLPMLADFALMVAAPILLRGNSSFSWVAGLLNTGSVFSPVIDGLTGGREHPVQFVPGNWPKLSELSGCTDLHITDK